MVPHYSVAIQRYRNRSNSEGVTHRAESKRNYRELLQLLRLRRQFISSGDGIRTSSWSALFISATLASQPVVDKRFEEGKRERPGPIRRSAPARMRRPQSAAC
jgi:hypothetical protein